MIRTATAANVSFGRNVSVFHRRQLGQAGRERGGRNGGPVVVAAVAAVAGAADARVLVRVARGPRT